MNAYDFTNGKGAKMLGNLVRRYMLVIETNFPELEDPCDLLCH